MLLRFRWFMIAFCMVVALAPFSGIAAAALLASAIGCEINDAAMEPCRAHGMNFGPLLSDLVSTASLGEVMFLILALAVTVWAVVEGLAVLFRLWRRRSRGTAA